MRQLSSADARIGLFATARAARIGRISALVIALLLALMASVQAQEDERFVASANGLGPATLEAEIDVEIIRAAYPEFSVDVEPFMAEGVRYERIVARADRAIVFTIELDDGRFRDITIFSDQISDPNGARVGDPLRDLSMRSRRFCILTAEGSAFVACPSSASDRLQYLFDTAPNLPPSGAPLTAIRIWQ